MGYTSSFGAKANRTSEGRNAPPSGAAEDSSLSLASPTSPHGTPPRKPPPAKPPATDRADAPPTRLYSGVHHRLQLAFGLEWATPPPPAPPPLRSLAAADLSLVDEVHFVLHASHVDMPSPLPEWVRPWLLTAHRCGHYLYSPRLRTRDVCGWPARDRAFATSSYTVHVPLELNSFLARSVSAPQVRAPRGESHAQRPPSR